VERRTIALAHIRTEAFLGMTIVPETSVVEELVVALMTIVILINLVHSHTVTNSFIPLLKSLCIGF